MEFIHKKKMNYDVEEVQNVYDIVDENEYADEVNKRKEEDWIVDDDGGYVEDGREIFDEEEDYAGSDSKTKTKDKGDKVKKEGVRSSNIKNMLMNMPSKKQVEEAKLEEDALLGDILGQIKSKSGSGIKKVVRAPIASSTTERNPFVKKGTGLKKVVTASKTSTAPSGGVEVMEEEETSTESQKVEEFDTQNMEGFDDEMDIQDFDEEMKEQEVAPEENTKEHEMNKARGFVSLAEGSGVGDGQWFSSGPTEQVVVQEVSVDSSTLPTTKLEGGEDVLRMYWLDAHEDPYKHPGTVWLFGKVAVQPRKFVSCCITVKNVPRRIYLAKRETHSKTGEPVTGMDLYNELNNKV